MSEYDGALMTVNGMKKQWAQLARAAHAALKDGKISTFEGLGLTFQVFAVAQQVTALLQGMDPAAARQLLHVLEHGLFVLPEA